MLLSQMHKEIYFKLKSILPHSPKFVVVFLLFSLSKPIQAEINPEIDSLRKILSIPHSDTDKISVLNKLSKALQDIDYHQYLQYWNESLQLSERNNDTINMVEAHFNIGQINVNYSLDYKTGIKHLLEALKLVRHTDRKKSEMSILSLIGFVHNRQGNFNKAIEYYKKAISIAEKYNYESEFIYYSSYIADLFEVNGMIDSAIVYYGKIYEIEEEQHFMHTRPVAMFSIGKYFQLKNKFELATRYYLEALHQFQNENNHRWESYTYHVLADLALKKKDYKTALEYANTGLSIADQYKLIKEISDNHLSLSYIHLAKGDYELAFKHYELHDAINDSIFSLDQSKEISNIQNNYEKTFKNQKLELLVQEKEFNELKLKQNRIILFCLSFAGLILIIFSVFLWRKYTLKKKINNFLIDRDELRELKMEEVINRLNQEVNQHKYTQMQLEATNEELNNFMYRSSHDLRSPLIAIISLAKIAAETTSEKERIQALEMICRSTEKLNRLLVEMVDATRVTHGNVKIVSLNFHNFVEGIVNQLKNADHLKNVNVQILADKKLQIHTDENFLRAILQNLIDNGIKYKNQAISNAFIKIEAEIKEEKFCITISDNGQGIAEDQQPKVFDMFVRCNYETQGSGLGLYIVKKSVKRLKGTIDLKSKVGVGTTFIVKLPIQVIEEL